MSDACAVMTMKSDDPELLSLVRSAREGDRDGADRLCTAVRPHMLRIALALGADPERLARRYDR